MGMKDYGETWQAMKTFTMNRDTDTSDEIWLLQHFPVYTQGIAGKPEHLLYNNQIPVVNTDRGGQITYHGPGQLIVYTLLEFRRLGLTVRGLVTQLEKAVIDLLAVYCIKAESRREAPGVYVNGAKIASLGLKIKNGFCYHGIALNVDMDMEPFAAINPCGYKGLQMTQLVDLGVPDDIDVISQRIAEKLIIRLSE
ncbi:MAG TPA: lipoyl(octanoyl) transferase LipB [Nitrosomonas sp.]|nr:lipoyl(octanoyl) transferase LipB [Nitrosomonas sp.]HMW21181.1 lipoyl(octanoyl) transferase LipB [Nitrosomonas sp.]HMW69743.1 lipoyl(octanoyl) transferase LipB [Nitrosomonas sp.]HMY62226.1 lipoyl(octanoyl) transferase LipB [Nitrosomonas sp.]HMY90480.1 lipoyl(octanoyl) transferase LipB [Nitrosomonas sp.]